MKMRLRLPNNLATQMIALLAIASLITVIGTGVFAYIVWSVDGGRDSFPGTAAQVGTALRGLDNVAPAARPALAAAYRDRNFSVQLPSSLGPVQPAPGLSVQILMLALESMMPPGIKLLGIEVADPPLVRVVTLLTDGQPVAIEVILADPFFLSLPLALVFLFLLVSTILLSVWAGRRLVAPLSRFAAAVDAFSAQVGGTPLVEEGPVEIRQATRAFNRMRERILKLIDDRTRMLMAISHDLRTPLTRLNLRAEELLDSPEKKKMLDDVKLMDGSINAAVTFFREGVSSDTPVMIDLTSLVQTICDQFADTGHSVEYRGPDRLPVLCQPSGLSRAVTNLVDNATKFGSSVVVSVARAGNTQVLIEVTDDGPGIPDSEKAAVFEPFYRSDKARQNISGFGLGLAIALTVVHNHGGTLSLHDRKPHGLRARLRLPLVTKD